MHWPLRHWGRRGVVSHLLLPVSALYAALRCLHALPWRIGWRKPERLPVPVVVVGNLIAGGAGKTPAVLAIVELLRARGWRPGIVSRGYGRRERSIRSVGTDSRAEDVGDEPLLLHLRSHAPVVVAADRPAAARHLLREHPGVDVIVSDDGLQHRALVRDLAVVVFDERGAGNGFLLPAGPLREPLPKTLPARTLVLYNSTEPTTPLPGSTSRRGLSGAVALADWWAGAPADAATLAALRARPVLAAAGIAQPQPFFDMLREAGLHVTELALPDHHDYAVLPWPAGTADVAVTEKDAVKLRPERAGSTRVWVVPLNFEPDAAFAQALLGCLRATKEHGHATG